MKKLVLKNVCKRYDNGNIAVNNISFEIEDKEFIILVGPSGCGKSTTLRMIAGLEEISDGEIWIDDELMNFVPTQDRELSMVFQNYALYPTMNVFNNIAFSLSIRKVGKDIIKEKVNEVAKMLKIETLLDRYPNQLSGGQKQRVAIGSAILRRPRLFMMDEPLSNLDANLREEMRIEIASLYEKLETTFVYVTHDQIEAMTLGTRIVVLNKGEVQQIDNPTNLYEKPNNLFVATFIGSPQMNIVVAKAVELAGEVILETINETWRIPIEHQDRIRECNLVNKRLYLGIRPEFFTHTTDGKDVNCIEGTVVNKEVLGGDMMIYVTDHGNEYVAKINVIFDLQIGDKICLKTNTDNISLFEMETELNLLNYRKDIKVHAENI